MGLVIICDGCEQKLDSDTAKKFGRIEPAYYCKSCAETWESYVKLLGEKRIEFLRSFAEWRTAAQEMLSLKRLPDA